MSLLLIRYNELGLKSPRVRSRFQKQLIRNIEDKFLNAALDCFIDSDWGRIYLHTDDQAQGIQLLTRVFGITSVSPVITTSNDISEITKAVISYSEDLLKPGKMFALRTRRTGKHPYTSMELAEQVGREILEQNKNKRLKVNLSEPDIEIFIEVRNKQSFIFSESYPGPGGLPMGTQGKILSIITDENSFIATWLMMKRGCRAYPVYFSNNGASSTLQADQANDQVELLRPWAGKIQLKIIDSPTDTHSFLENRELLNYIQKVNAKGICLSCNLENFSTFNNIFQNELPIFYPLIGLEENLIKDLQFRILGNKAN